MEGRNLKISRNREAIKDFALATALICIAVVITIVLWNSEFFINVSQKHDEWRLNQAIPLLVIVLAIVGLFGLRRWTELVKEIAERVRAEAQLQESEEKYRLLVENVNDAIVINREDKILFFNKKFAEMLGYEPAELLNRGYREISTVESAALLLERKKRAEKGVPLPSRYETVFRKKDGHLIHIEANVVDLVYKGEPCTFGVFRDITERKVADEKIQGVHQLYRNAIQNSDSVLYRLNLITNEYEFVGGQCKEILGISEEEWTPRSWADMKQEVIVTDPECTTGWKEYEEAFRRGDIERYRADVRIVTPEGKEKWISDSAVSLRDENTGQAIGALGIAQDITDRRRAEREVYHKNERLEILNAVALVTTGSMTPEEMSDRLLLQIRKVMKCDAFFISSFDPENKTVHQLRTYDTFDDEIRLVPPAHESAPANPTLMRALGERKPVLLLRKAEELPKLETITFGDKTRKSASLLFVPLIVGDRVLGILSVQSYQLNAYNEEQVDLLMAIAHQFGPALEASMLGKQVRDNEERERHFGEKLQSLIEASNELSLTTSLDELCRKAVEIGHRRLGFDRIGVWLRTSEGATEVRGTYGIGLKGEVISKSHRTIPLGTPDGVFPMPDENQEPLVLKEDIPLWEEHKKVGQGSSATAVMKDRELVIGYLCIDNLLTQKEIDGQQSRLLQLYASTIAALCADKKREEELRQTHQIYRSSIENSNGVPYRYDYRTKEYEYIGAKCESLLGVPAEDFGPKYWKNCIRQVVVIDPNAPKNVKEYSEAFKRGEVDTYRTDIRIVTPAGEERWINDCSVPIIDESTATVIGSQGIMTDVTQRKLDEQQLLRHQEQLAQEVAERTADLRQTNLRLEQEIDEHKKTEMALEESQGKLDAMLCSISDIMVMMDRDLNVIWANDTAKDFYGPDVVGRKCYEAFRNLKEPCEPSPCLVLASFEDGEIHHYENEIADHSGGKHVFHCTSNVALRDADGRPETVLEISRDITELKRIQDELEARVQERTAALIDSNKKLEEDIKARERAEEGLEKANQELRETTAILVHTERMNALGELTAGVAHELNQPLNNVKILCQSILRDIDKERLEIDELPQDLKDVVAQIDKMARIIDHMRVFTRRSDGVYKQKIDPNVAVKNMFVLLGQQLRTHGINVITELPDGLPQVNADPIALEQVVTILVINARCAVEDFRKTDRRIEVRSRVYSDSEVAISVKDNGGGVPEHLQKKIFEPFFTTKPPGKGTGLGLSIATKIIDEHNGRLELEVEKDEGSTFTVVIPTADSEQKEHA